MLTLQELMEKYHLSMRKATQMAKESGALLPRKKGQKYYVVESKFESYLLEVAR